MPDIWIDTIRTSPNSFDLIQYEVVGFWCKAERIIVLENEKDRMIAAITNLGCACRHIADNNIKHPLIVIITDADTVKGKEHQELYEIVGKPYSDYLQLRGKLVNFYGDKIRYLDKIERYITEWKIKIELKPSNDWV
jgi:hypothetical protein